LQVKTVHGKDIIKLPNGVQDGKVFKITAKGAPRLNTSGNGDHLVKIKVHIPEKLSKREKELYLELAKESGIDVKKGGLFW